MKIAMQPDEIALFESLLRCSDNYFEFGCGGSTILACKLVRQSVRSIESSKEWISTVEKNAETLPLKPTVTHIDIGPVGQLGYPADKSKRDDWHLYSQAVDKNADLYLVDGRFRVACFARTVLVARPGSMIAIHDYASRPHYHIASKMVREVARARDMSVFVVGENVDYSLAMSAFEDYKYDPN